MMSGKVAKSAAVSPVHSPAAVTAGDVAAVYAAERNPRCRFCNAELTTTFVDLGLSPLAQNHIEPGRLNESESFWPLHVWLCKECLLVQLEEYVAPAAIFSEYAYFSSYSDSWIEHARRYSETMIERFEIGHHDLVVEIASNDGYLLQHFLQYGIPVHGIDPAANVAAVARERGVPTTVEFFGETTARSFAETYGQPRLLIGNNVLAHVPDINDFVAGMRVLLAPDGVITMEFPHLLQLMENNQFDTIYHEHFSYLSFMVVERIFSAQGLTLFDVEEIPTHGGSLRIYARHREDDGKSVSRRVLDLRARESERGMLRMSTYTAFGERVHATKRRLLSFLIEAKENGKTISGYGAPGKGNTLLNYCGIRTDFLDFTVDRSPHKQGRYTPGTRIPILGPEAIRAARPDYLLILPWNLHEEIRRQTAFIREWGGQWIVPIPELRVFDELPKDFI
jgi:SAM-dependent methyltransferase